MISREGNEEFSKTRNCHLRSTCSNCKCKSQVGTVQLVHGDKNQVSWGCKNKSRANTWISESWKVRSPVTHLEYPKRCAEVFICPHDRRHDHYSLQALSFSLLPFPRPGRALSSPLLLYSSLPPSPPLSLSLFLTPLRAPFTLFHSFFFSPLVAKNGRHHAAAPFAFLIQPVLKSAKSGEFLPFHRAREHLPSRCSQEVLERREIAHRASTFDEQTISHVEDIPLVEFRGRSCLEIFFPLPLSFSEWHEIDTSHQVV